VPSAPTPESGTPECDAATAAGIDETLAAQLAAFAAEDFRAAFRLASETFRASVDLKGFRAIILDGYPEVAAATSHRVVECRQPSQSSASALVTVTGENGVTAQLGYRFVLEADGWHVDGATLLGRKAQQSA
jgi:hypothetical protein